jgi:hypothetical protein
MLLGGATITNSLSTAGFAPYTDTFLARLDAAGNVAWMKLIDRQTGGYARDKSGVGLALDGAGDPVLTASYNDRPTFDSYQFASPPPTGLLAAKYDTQGAFQWALAVNALRVSGQEWATGGGTPLFVGNTLGADSVGNVYLTGAFRSTDGPVLFGSHALTSHTDPFGVPSYDLFVTKLGGGVSPPTPPRLGLVRILSGGVIQLQVSGATSSVVIESSRNLNDWSSVGTHSVVEGWVSFTDPLADQPGAHFYRILRVP